MRDDPEDIDELATGLATFFGAAQMKNEPWVPGVVLDSRSGSVMPSERCECAAPASRRDRSVAQNRPGGAATTNCAISGPTAHAPRRPEAR